MPPAAWRLGRKVRVWFAGVEFREAAEEAARADQERAEKEQERARAEPDRARAELLAQRLRALGLDPDAP